MNDPGVACGRCMMLAPSTRGMNDPGVVLGCAERVGERCHGVPPRLLRGLVLALSTSAMAVCICGPRY